MEMQRSGTNNMDKVDFKTFPCTLYEGSRCSRKNTNIRKFYNEMVWIQALLGPYIFCSVNWVCVLVR